jgi:hypothetical protein
MRPLSKFLKGGQESQRLERKFVMSPGQGLLGSSILKSFGFFEKYSSRKVNSIYFDDIDLNCLRENINGNANRDKLRFRFYDTNFFSAKIEIKHKRSSVGYKTTMPLKGCASSIDELIAISQMWCDNNLSKKFHAASIVSYTRRYFEDKNGFRATIDTGVSGYRILGSRPCKRNVPTYEVIELKYPLSLDSRFRDIYPKIQNIAMRNTKCSKYTNSMMNF